MKKGLRFTPELAINGPEIDYIDTKARTVYFKPHNEQIEVFKYCRHGKGEHVDEVKDKTYPPHKGKRFRPHCFLKKGQTSWIVPIKNFRGKTRNYFKFCFRGKNNERTALTTITIGTSSLKENNSATLIRMYN